MTERIAMATRKVGDDLDKIASVLLDFFSNKRVKKALKQVHDYEVTGWEKWWQVELALYLSNSDDTIAEWDMEHQFEADQRKRTGQTRMALDIGFRLVRQSKDQWYFVELKQADDYRQCIDRMCKDAEKVFSAKKNSVAGIGIKYIACAGVFIDTDIDDVEAHLDKVCEEYGIVIDGYYYRELCEGYSLLVF
jgi:hypothetical protein